MSNSDPKGGDSAPVSRILQWRRGTFEGRPVVFVSVSRQARELMVSLGTWDYFLALGLRPPIWLKDNGRGKYFAAFKTKSPNQGPHPTPDFLGRTLMAIIMIVEEVTAKKEGREVERASLDYKRIVTRNGDPFDLRDENLMVLPGRRCGWKSVDDVRRRWRIRFPEDGSPGQDPNTRYASLRRAEQEARRLGAVRATREPPVGDLQAGGAEDTPEASGGPAPDA